jgi:hypothetical protein
VRVVNVLPINRTQPAQHNKDMTIFLVQHNKDTTIFLVQHNKDHLHCRLSAASNVGLQEEVPANLLAWNGYN